MDEIDETPDDDEREEDDEDLADLAELRVLLVEDDEDALLVTARVLEACGAEVRAVTTAQEAMKVLPVFHPDVVVSDLGLPDEDGCRFMRRLRALDADHGATVPAIALTGRTEIEDSAAALRAGYQVHVAKPIDPWLLSHAVANVAGLRVSFVPQDDPVA